MLKEEKQQRDIPEYRPGDKIYKLFKHDIVIIRGRDEEFIIRIVRLKKE
ncbi:hypothetical protein GM661_14820 [Iocasia frigidifontis]|uniref:Uncharacterized protein n=1 Tax=Iocasia fonsfrigidae TaxID=2682810 RepID=A0A8A7KH98_9FIRM|nr:MULTISPECIES: hypothetical protein [Halanaerobiaceae]QTL99138.1 hypothetical protein GM661_14820 [Iocasia fonsfrigidae]